MATGRLCKVRIIWFVMISAFLGGSLSLAPSFPIVNAQSSDLSTQLNPLNGLDRNVISQGLSVAPSVRPAQIPGGFAQGLTTIPGGFAQGLSPTANFCPGGSTSSTLTIAKNNPVSPSQPFTVQITNGGVQGTVQVSQLQSASFCISPGLLTVVESPGNSPAYQLTNNGQIVSSTSCNTSVQAGQLLTCTITNSGSNIIGGGFVQGKETPSPSGTNTAAIGLASSIRDINPSIVEASPPGAPNRLTNPPFQTCAANTQNKTSLLTINNQNLNIPLPTRLPSSGTYVISGNADLGRLQNALDQFGTHTIRIELYDDLANMDRVLLGLNSPQFTGKIIVENDDGARQKVIPFNVDTVRTECKFITLAKAFNTVAPLGVIGNKKGSITAPATNKELVGGIEVGSSAALTGLPFVLNPPFATCQTDTTQTGIASAPDNLAIYIIKGSFASHSELSGHKRSVLLTADLVQRDTDAAKIVKTNGNNANNPVLVANLISNENQNNARKLDFTLEDVNTDCKQISLSTKSIFSPLPGETDP